jgi:hypothetical protein
MRLHHPNDGITFGWHSKVVDRQDNRRTSIRQDQSMRGCFVLHLLLQQNASQDNFTHAGVRSYGACGVMTNGVCVTSWNKARDTVAQQLILEQMRRVPGVRNVCARRRLGAFRQAAAGSSGVIPAINASK